MIKILRPLRAIRAKCLLLWISNEVKACELKNCTLHPYRLGKRPKTINYPTEAVSSENGELRAAFLKKKGIAGTDTD